jgi:hypothetical protein
MCRRRRALTPTQRPFKCVHIEVGVRHRLNLNHLGKVSNREVAQVALGHPEPHDVLLAVG